MITVLPERSLPALTLIIFLRRAAGDQLHTLGDNVGTAVFDQKMNVIGRDHVIENRKPEPLLGLEEPKQIAAPIAGKL